MTHSWEEAKKAIRESSKESSVYIGCDSVRYRTSGGKWKARYSTVVVLHKDSRSGCQLFHNTVTLDDYGKKTESLMQRLTQEVAFAVEAVQELEEAIGDRYMEVHVDINTDAKHASNQAASMAAGYVLGVTGRKPKFKPEAWCAAHAADHVARQLSS
jgi:predicted RNase H-related nuclease YkuK (DUF458 family)